MKSNLPIFEFLITDDETDMSGVSAFSLVSKPAIKSDFVKFSDTPMQKYIFIEKDAKKYKGIVAGIAMKPNELIPRVNDKGEKFYGYFSPETIDKIRTKFHSNPENLKSVNLEHNDKTYVNAFLVESYILDSQEMVNAVKAKGIKDATIGSWYTAFKIVDKDIFERCLKGEFNGFSVEAFLNMELSKNNFSVLNIEKKMKKTIIQKFKERLDSLIEEMSFKEALVPELNIKLTWGSVGDEVTKTYQDTEGNEKTEAVGAGEFVIEDGRTIVTDDNSALLEIREKPAEEMAKEEEMPEEEKKEELPEEEEMPVSGDTKQKKTKEEICAECPDCPECLEEEDMMVEEEFAPMGNTNACKHGGRSTNVSGYCNGMGSPEKSTGTYKQGKKVKKEEKPEAEKKAEAPKAEEKPKADVDVKKGKEAVESIRDTDTKKALEDLPVANMPAVDGYTDEENAEIRKALKEMGYEDDKIDKAIESYNARMEKEAKDIARKAAREKKENLLRDRDRDLSGVRNKYWDDARAASRNWWEAQDKYNTMKENGAAADDLKTAKTEMDAAKKEMDRVNGLIERDEAKVKRKYGFAEMIEFPEIVKEDFSALQTENEALKAEVEALKVKLSEPIAEPKLKDVEIKGEVKELSVYELVARRNGLPII